MALASSFFELNQSGPKTLPTALPALHNEMTRDLRDESTFAARILYQSFIEVLVHKSITHVVVMECYGRRDLRKFLNFHSFRWCVALPLTGFGGPSLDPGIYAYYIQRNESSAKNQVYLGAQLLHALHRRHHSSFFWQVLLTAWRYQAG
jgi:hypothetical protein